MNLKHIAVTQKQWDETWNALPAEMRFYPVEEPRYQAGFMCFALGGLLVWPDYLMPEDQWSEEVHNAVASI